MIFVDTSFWVALRNQRDPQHSSATALLTRHQGTALVTSNHVRGETWTYLRRKAGHQSAVGFLDQLDKTRLVEVVPVTPGQEVKALRWLRRHDEREYSFVDASSFAVMAAMRIREAFAFDGDFSAAGFLELRA